VLVYEVEKKAKSDVYRDGFAQQRPFAHKRLGLPKKELRKAP